MDRIYPSLEQPFRDFLATLGGKRLAVVSHARPDGDCIGAQVAMVRVLRALGHSVICVNPDPVPRRLRFLVGTEAYYTVESLPPGDFTTIYVDCADQERAGEKLQARFGPPYANFDHHVSNRGYARFNFVDAGSAATCEILAGLFFDQGLPIDATAAQGLYAGILTDTGQFRFNSTTRRTFLLVAELMACGACPAEAGFELYERETAGKLKLLQHFLSSLELECEGRLCIGNLPDRVFAETNTTQEDTEGLVDYARSIEGVEVGVLIEERPGAIKASLRAKNPAYRVDRIAALFKGGGHACAAGLNLKNADFATFRQQLVDAIAAQMAVVDAAAAPS